MSLVSTSQNVSAPFPNPHAHIIISASRRILAKNKDAANCRRLLSLDVEAMFPSISTSEAAGLVRDLLVTHHDKLSEVSPLAPTVVADLLQLSIHHTPAVVQYGNQPRWFRQTQRLAMGKSYSP